MKGLYDENDKNLDFPVGVFSDSGGGAAAIDLRRDFENRLAAFQKLEPPATPADILAGLQAKAGLMASYSAWMRREEADLTEAIARFDAVRKRVAVNPREEAELLATRRHAAEIAAVTQAKIAKLRAMAMDAPFTDGGASLETMEKEVAGLEAIRKRRSQPLDDIEPAVARLTWNAWFFGQQADTASILSEVFQSRNARIQLSADREQALRDLEGLLREWREKHPAGALGALPEWPAIRYDEARPGDRKMLEKAVKRALGRR